MAPPVRPAWDRLSRREVLQLLAAGSAGLALAACGGGNGSGTKNTAKVFDGGWPYLVPPEGTFNLVDPNAILVGGPYADLVVPPLGEYYWKTKQWMHLLGQSWSVDSSANTFTVKLVSGVKWEDGKPLTSQDLLTTLWVEWINGYALWNYIDRIEAPDQQTVTVHMSTPSTVVERYILKQNVVSDAQYGQFAKRAQALFASGAGLSSAEGKALAQALQTYRPSTMYGCGPFKLEPSNITNSQLTLVKNPGGLFANQVKFEKILLYNGETPTITPIVLQKKVDYATHGFPPATISQYLQEGIRIVRPPTYGGNGMIFNMGKHAELGDPRVRQAFAHAVDRAQNGKVALGQSGVAVKYMTGFSDLLVPQWMSQSDIGKLNTYPFDTAKASQLLQQAGWKKSGGQWQKPDGTAAEYEILFPAEFADTSASATDAASQLTKFGIKVTPRSETFTQWPIDLAKGNFDLGALVWGSTTQPHPQFSYVVDLLTYNYAPAGGSVATVGHQASAANQGGKGMDFPLVQTTSQGQIDFNKLITDSAMGLDETAQKQNVTQIALAFNELQPVLQFHERYGNNPCLQGVRCSDWPPDSDPILQNAPYGDNFTIMLIYTGGLHPV
ncbi:MAG: ABC transporter substrate-binding protein [Candidatus Dormiibacterota bacterium]